jgi:hypothetical protein
MIVQGRREIRALSSGRFGVARTLQFFFVIYRLHEPLHSHVLETKHQKIRKKQLKSSTILNKHTISLQLNSQTFFTFLSFSFFFFCKRDSGEVGGDG